MRIALSSYSGYGAWFILRLLEEGHKVDYYLSEPKFDNILKGIIPAPIVLPTRGWYKNINYSKYDVSIFDLTGREKQAELSASVCPTIGDGAFNCAAEDNRSFGLEIMEECEVQVPMYERFTDVGEAKSFIKKTDKRYVFKPDGGQDQETDTTYISKDAEDMLKYIDKVFSKSKGVPFILQEFIKGTEVSVEGWFNGEEFYLLNCTLEEKKFMNDNKGPNTGCAGNLIFNFGNTEPSLYKQGLAKMKPYLQKIGYTGMLDLNTIVNKQGLYGLEWTPRFGYDASAALLQLYGGDFGELLYRTALGEVPELQWKEEFCAGVRLSIPPYPSEIPGKHPRGIPIEGIEEEDIASTFIYDVELEKDNLVSAGHNGFIASPMGTGNTIEEAFDIVDEKIKKIKIPQMQYRTDIKKSTLRRYNELDLDGWLK